MRTCFVAALLAVLAFAALGLSAATPASAQDYCYYSTAEQLWVCPAPYAARGYARRDRCYKRKGRWICRAYR
jgi:hypothetical protein